MDLIANPDAQFKTTVPKMTTDMPGHADTFNPYFQLMIDNDAALERRILDLSETSLQGDSNFHGEVGVSIMHNLGHTDYIVNIISMTNTDGDLGDVWFNKAANAFTIFNSGGYRGLFRYQILT